MTVTVTTHLQDLCDALLVITHLQDLCCAVLQCQAAQLVLGGRIDGSQGQRVMQTLRPASPQSWLALPYWFLLHARPTLD